MDANYDIPLGPKQVAVSLHEACPCCDCETKPKNSRFKRSIKGISRTSRRWWSTTAQTTSHVGYKTKIWFQALPPVIWFEAKFPGWQAGVAVGIIVALFVLVFNSLFLIFAVKNHWGPDGLGTLVEGDCAKINRLNKVAHGFINTMSTFLLIQSNYCMQLLASPTRRDVDIAHRNRQWVDIGVQSFRNVWKRHISPWRCLYWMIFAISSVPLHLLWNSVVIFSPSAFQYNQLTVTQDFIDGKPFNYDINLGLDDADPVGGLWPDDLYALQKDLGRYTSMDNIACKRAYAQSFVRDRSDVIVVTAPPSADSNNTIILGASVGGSGAWPYKWLCPADSSENFRCYDQIRKQSETWSFSKYGSPDVKYCMSKQETAQCKLQYGYWITLFTIIANILKVICFFLTFRVMKHHTTDKDATEGKSRHREKLLITTGDAIASFLEHPDHETRGMSIVEKKDFRNGIWKLRWVPIGSMIWRNRSECSWFRAIGSKRWLVGMIPLAALPIAPTIFLLTKAQWLTQDIGLSSSAITALGIGNPSGLFLFGSTSTSDQYLGWRLLGKVALANMPQLFVSIAYYLWNNHLTAMIAANEYDKYAAPTLSHDGDFSSSNKRGLRVTNPQRGTDQVSTRFLTVPLKYWVVNIVIWTLLHYLASQAIFFARVDMLDHWHEITQNSISQIGYSVLGLVYFIVCGYVVFVFAVWTSLRRLRNRMPLAATCSGALGAACHPRDPGLRHHERRVHWGVEITTYVHDDISIDDEKGERLTRCTFTSEDAHYPEPDRYYT